MIKTKIKRIFAIIALTALLGTYFSTAFAAIQIGTGSVNGDASFDSSIMWDENFPGSASGSVSNIVITANVAPTLNMTISTGAIALGELSASSLISGSLDIEIGTNAVDGVVVTARSGSGGLTNTSDNTVQINNLTVDGVAETYTFSSALNAATDSSYATIVQTASLNADINDNTTEHVVYTTDKPEATDGINDVTFTVSSQIDSQTPSGSYQDTVTFTVTGTF